MIQGFSIGTFMGVIGGVALLFLLLPAVGFRGGVPITVTPRLILHISGVLLTLPGVMFGGSWMSNRFLGLWDLANFSESYTLSLDVSFLAIVAYPLACFIVKLGRSISESRGGRHA